MTPSTRSDNVELRVVREARSHVYSALMQPGGDLLDLDELLHRPAWQQRAACRDSDPQVFFPTDGTTLAEARRICAGCTVRSQCAEFALGHSLLKGIWAGESERSRARRRAENAHRGAPERGIEPRRAMG
jgi:WhiB family redox-sensing transcriptional regulator